MPIPGLAWLFVEVETDEGISGLGECTDYAVNNHLVRGLEAVKPLVIGSDPNNIEEIWQRIFHVYSDLNGRGYVSHLISAIDIALWDIKGKVLGAPIYDLLGGPVRKSVPLYTHVRDISAGAGIDTLIEEAKLTVAAGYSAIKTDPFPNRRTMGETYYGANTTTRSARSARTQTSRCASANATSPAGITTRFCGTGWSTTSCPTSRGVVVSARYVASPRWPRSSTSG